MPRKEARTGEARTGTKQEPPIPATTLHNPRHEAFCQHFVLSGNATGAAAAAGYRPRSARNQGYRLMQQAAVRARIAAVRRGLARAYCLDAQVLLGKLEAVYQRANENHHFHAAARAVEIQSKIARQTRPRPAPEPTTGEEVRQVPMRTDRDQTTGEERRQGGAGGTPETPRVRDRDETRGEEVRRTDRDQTTGEERSDRDIKMTTNDDKFGLRAEVFPANSIPCVPSGGLE